MYADNTKLSIARAVAATAVSVGCQCEAFPCLCVPGQPLPRIAQLRTLPDGRERAHFHGLDQAGIDRETVTDVPVGDDGPG